MSDVDKDTNTDNKNTFTLAQIQQAVPKKLAGSITKEFVDDFNNIVNDPEIAENIRENFFTYSMILREGKYKVEDYFNAVKYVSFKIMGLNNKEAFMKAFPDRYSRYVACGFAEKDINSRITAFHKKPMVQSILAKTIIPFHILNQDARQEALNVQVKLMLTAKSEMVRSKAADSVLAYTAEPTATGPLLNVNLTKTDALDNLEKTITELAMLQKQAIQNNVVTTKAVAEQKIIDAEVIEDDRNKYSDEEEENS